MSRVPCVQDPQCLISSDVSNYRGSGITTFVEEPYARQYWGPPSREGRWKNLFSDMGLAQIPKVRAVNSAPYDVETAYSPHR